MFKLSKNIQSNFPGEEKCYLYANLCMYYYIHPCRLQFGSTKKCAFKKVFGWQEENLNQQYQVC